MSRSPRGRVAAGALVAAGLLGSGYGVAALLHRPHSAAAVSPPASPAFSTTTSAAGSGTDPLARDILRLQGLVRARSTDAGSLALLGLDYVQQAKITVDPSYYPKAEGVLARSLALNSTTNYQAIAGEAAYRAALHDFTGARIWALRGLRIDPYSAALYGSLTDAETQLGHYAAATAAAQKMLDVNPGVPALSRAEYVFELRGQVDQARAVLDRALAAANTPSDKAFVHQTASDLAFNSGKPQLALAEAQSGLVADPAYTSLLESKAKAEAALGMTDAALTDFAQLVEAAPQPQFLVEYGEYLDSLGRSAQAQQQYALFDVEGRLFTANGVTLDTDPTLFYADHGRPARALQYGRAGLAIRPFVEMQDAYAWALHANGRDAEALTYTTRAAVLGTRSALFAFHRGMIEQALGHRQAALASLERALALNPTFSPRDVPLAHVAIARLKAQR